MLHNESTSFVDDDETMDDCLAQSIQLLDFSESNGNILALIILANTSRGVHLSDNSII